MAIEAKTNRVGAPEITRRREPTALSGLTDQTAVHVNSRTRLGVEGAGHLQKRKKLLTRGILGEFARKWGYLRSQRSFRLAPIITTIRLISWRARCLLHWAATTSIDKWGVRMFLPAEWRGIAKLVFAFREHYEPELGYLEEVLSRGKTFVDVGACYGIYTLAASKIVGKEGRVIAFEPAPRAFRVLQKNLELNCLKNVLAYPLALTERKGKAWLYRHPNVGCDSLGRDHSFTESKDEIATESLDNILRKISVDQVDVIKMDVQGAEELVLRGASKILKSQHPVVIFEVYPQATVPLGLRPYGAWELLESLGYELFVVDQQGALRREKSPPDESNVVAIHTQR
jgi:FkbM family methyltransferase